jgi:hypothetical protein
VSTALDDLLGKLTRGETRLADACAAIGQMASSQPDAADSLRQVLTSQVRSGRVAPEIAQPLLAALQEAATARTAFRSAAPAVEGTRIRDRELAAATLLRPPPPSETQVRPAPEMRPDPPAASETRARGAGDRSRPELVPGSIIKERFVLQDLIGRGGMGTVFRALDRSKEIARNPHPHVAIKILNKDFSGHPHALMALEREASKAQSLAHPNIVTVFDFDLAGDTPFITMELLQGSALEKAIASARPSGMARQRAIPIIRGIAEGLAHAHKKGIVHSDLKPANVFLAADDTPKILDFGIARAVPTLQAPADREDVFDAGELGAYTPAYATEEMVAGSDPNPADDLYALGLIAYELLTGRHPFRRESAGKARELALKPAPVRSLKRREWKALERCLAFDAASRPRDASDFIRIFFGVTPLTKGLLAAAVVGLALVSGYLWYENVQETGPVVPLSALPAATQQQVLGFLKEGRAEWGFYERDHNMMQLWSAVDRYAEAYKLHPRNRDAVNGLRLAADELLGRADLDSETRRAAAVALEEKSEYLARYKPVVDAAGMH